MKFTEILAKKKVQAILVCGDRYETLAPCLAATFLKNTNNSFSWWRDYSRRL